MNYPADFATAQSGQQPSPGVLPSAATLSPKTKFTFVTDQVQLANLVPPDPAGYCELTLCFTHAAPGAFLTNGTSYPIKTAYQPIQNRPVDLCWDPVTNFWWVKAVV